MTRCHVCERPCVYEVDPACGSLPAVTEPDVWRVVARNGLIIDVCQPCWQLWPDPWKRFPEVGFGRWPVDVEAIVRALQETA